MRYKNPELIEKLAAEYVLGTMRGKARDRFEGLMYESYSTRLAVWSWESQLGPLSQINENKKVPVRLWKKIQQRISAESTIEKEFNTLKKIASFWKGWGFSATAASLLLVGFTILGGGTGIEKSSVSAQIAVLSDDEFQPQWLVSLDKESGALSAKALNVSADKASRVFELWLLPDNNSPQSLGLLPVANETAQLPIATSIMELLSASKKLAVSIEPEGGSPTGLPTGPVVYQASFVEL